MLGGQPLCAGNRRLSFLITVSYIYFQTNGKGRLAPLTCNEYGTVKHIKIAQ